MVGKEKALFQDHMAIQEVPHGEWYDHGKSLVSCALGGAASMVAGISDAYMVANGPAWCYFYALRTSESPGLHLGQRFHCTYPSNDAVVFGTEKHVKETLSSIKDMPSKPGLVLLENSCALSLIGDDLAGFAADADMPCPIITMDSGGTLGDYWAGYKKALKETLKLVDFSRYKEENLIEKRSLEGRSDEKSDLLVNFIGCSTHYYNEYNDMEELSDLLASFGIGVHVKIALGHTMKDLETLGKASLNIVIHKELGEESAKWLEKKLKIPYIAPILPYGLKGTQAWVETVLEALYGPSYMDLAAYKAFLERIDWEKGRIFEFLKDLQRLWGEPWFEKVIFSGPTSVLEGMSRVWKDEWFDAGQVAYVYHDSMSNYEALEGDSYEDFHDVRGHTWQHMMDDFTRGLLLGTNHEKLLLQEGNHENWAYQTIAKPVEDDLNMSFRPFMGIHGNRCMLDLVWRLYMEAVEREGLVK